MPSPPHGPTGQSELRRQIADARSSQKPLSATFVLKSPPHKSLLSPEETEVAVRDLVARVEGEVASKVQGVNVLPYLQSFTVRAPADVVERLAAQPEIDAVLPSQAAEDVVIRPVERKEVPGPSAPKSPKSPPRRGAKGGRRKS